MKRPYEFDSDLADDSIDGQAAAWFTRNRQQQGRAVRKAFEQWLREPEHAKAYRAFEELWADLGELQQLNRPAPLKLQKPKHIWRPALAVAAALIGAVLATQLGTSYEIFQQQIAAQS